MILPIDVSTSRRAKSGETLVLNSPEDTILRELRWYCAGGQVTDRQWRDVVEVIRVNRRARRRLRDDVERPARNC
jgi:hypothetical protein